MSSDRRSEDKAYTGDRKILLDYLPSNINTLLDIGCSYGEFGKLIKQREVIVWGVEPVKEAASAAARVLDVVINGFFDIDAPIPDDYFDVITFNDSLEHFPEPNGPLLLAKRKLKKNGILVCCVPNVRYVENIKNLLFSRDWRYTPMGILDNTHLRFFTEKSIRRTIIEAGYQITRLEGINAYMESGWKTKFVLPFLGMWAKDMKYYQLVIVAKPNRQAEQVS
jgi:SAM-dependent methyltransferase